MKQRYLLYSTGEYFTRAGSPAVLNPPTLKKTPSNAVVVCLVMRHFHPVLAGAAERFRRYAPGLQERGVRFEVVTSHSDPALPVHEWLDDCIQVHRVDALDQVTTRFDDRRLFQAARQMLRSGEVEAEVVQTTLASTSLLPPLWALRASGLKLLHVGIMVGEETDELPWLRRVARRLRHRLCLSPFHQMVVSSSAMRRWNECMGINRDRMSIISNGVNTSRFRPAADENERCGVRSELGLPVKGPIVLFVGGLLPRKGLHLLLEAWPQVLRAFPTACLVVVGPTARPTVIHAAAQRTLSAYQKEIQALADLLPPSSVRFEGQRPDVERFFRAASLFVLPSQQEGMGNVVLEAYASGLPCLLADFTGLPTEEFGAQGREFVCVPREAAALGAAVLQMLSSGDELEAMSRHARAWATTHLALETTLDLYAALYHRLAGSRQRL